MHVCGVTDSIYYYVLYTQVTVQLLYWYNSGVLSDNFVNLVMIVEIDSILTYKTTIWRKFTRGYIIRYISKDQR